MRLYYVCANNGKLTISKCVAPHLILATHIFYYPIFTLSPTKTQRGALPFSIQGLVFNLNFLSPPVFLLPLLFLKLLKILASHHGFTSKEPETIARSPRL